MTSIQKTAVIHALCDMGLDANNKGNRSEAIALSNAISGLIRYWRDKK
jgi:hypothetical protein